MNLLRGIFQGGPQNPRVPSLRSVTFDTAPLRVEHRSDDRIEWRALQADVIVAQVERGLVVRRTRLRPQEFQAKGRPTAALAGIALFVGLAGIPLLGVATGAVQQAGPSGSLDIVRLDVSVTRDHQPIGDLKPEHLNVVDNGVKQTLTQAVRDDVPLEAFFVLDTSLSINEAAQLQQIKAAVRSFVADLKPSDKVALVTASSPPAIRQPPTNDFESFFRVMDQVATGGNTALYDAIRLALMMRKPAASRAVIVLLTDGEDTESGTPSDRVMEAAEQSDVIVYAVLVRSGFHPPMFRQFPRSLAAATGGLAFDAEFTRGLETTFRSIVTDARERYRVTYHLPGAVPGWHKVRITLNGVRGEVRARGRYFARPISEPR